MDPAFQQVRVILHQFINNEAIQFENIQNKKLRTDAGYSANLNTAVEAVIKAVRDAGIHAK